MPPPRVTFERASEDNKNTFRHLVACLFPVPYPKKFFSDVASGRVVAFLVLRDGNPIGCLSWKEVGGGGAAEMEILTFGVLVLQRRKGIGTAMLEFLLGHVSSPRVTLHVHAANDDAVAFYRRRGFSVAKRVPNYYRRLEPTTDAFQMVLERGGGSGVENDGFSDDK